jgi:hypothetical protein
VGSDGNLLVSILDSAARAGMIRVNRLHEGANTREQP